MEHLTRETWKKTAILPEAILPEAKRLVVPEQGRNRSLQTKRGGQGPL